MSEVKREHLAGLELFKSEEAKLRWDNQSWDDLLDDLIAQASAAPEQEPAGHFSFCHDKKKWLQQKLKGPEFSHLLTPLYVHADPSEVERLRAEVELWKLRSGGNLYAAQVMEELADGQEAELVALEKKLADAQSLLRKYYTKPRLCAFASSEINAFLSATAQPAEPHDAETDDGSCPECEGACSDHCGPCRQCGGQGTFEAALRHAQPAEGQTNE